MKNGPIAALWESYRLILPREAGAAQIIETRRAFYGGAGSLFGTLVQLMEPGTEATENDLAVMEQIAQELRDYAATVGRPVEASPAASPPADPPPGSAGLCAWCRKREHTGSCDREALKAQIEHLRMTEATRATLPGDNVIMIRSLISNRNQKPRIDIQLGQAHTQMDADAAVKVARDMIECAAGSHADAFLFHFLKEKLGQPDQVGVQMIGDFRIYREELLREFEAMQEGFKPEP